MRRWPTGIRTHHAGRDSPNGWGWGGLCCSGQKTHSSYPRVTVAGLVVVGLLPRVAFASRHSPGAIYIRPVPGHEWAQGIGWFTAVS